MNRPLNILVLTPQLPYPAHQGTALRNYHNMRGLAQANRIDLLSFDESSGEAGIPPQLLALAGTVKTVSAPQRSMSRRLAQLLTTSRPDMALRLLSEDFRLALEQMLKHGSYDIVQVEGIELAWTIPTIRQMAPGAQIIYDAHNAETLLQRRAGEADRGSPGRLPAVVYSGVQSSRLARYEAWVCQEADAVTAVSDKDREALLDLAGLPESAVTVIPNSIDVADYDPAEVEVETAQRFDFVFSGKMDYRPNVDAVLWFADAVWPRIKEAYPEATWAVVGQKPHARLDRLGYLQDVTVTGWVPDVRPYVAGAGVFIMPFRVGSGTRLKLIEAMAAGKAIVSTRVGVEGFPVEDGIHLEIGDTAEAFAVKCVDLLHDYEQRAFLGKNGRQLAQVYDWRVVVPRFQKVYDDLLGG